MKKLSVIPARVRKARATAELRHIYGWERNTNSEIRRLEVSLSHMRARREELAKDCKHPQMYRLKTGRSVHIEGGEFCTLCSRNV